MIRDQDLWDGELRGIVDERGRKIALVRIDGVIHAYEDRCAHLGIALSEGTLAGCVLTCRAHHWTYDACTGRGINPASTRLVEYPVSIVDGKIVIA